jgi:hypothetical protein
MQPTGRGGRGSARALAYLMPSSGSVDLCGHGHDGLQLICNPLGTNGEAPMRFRAARWALVWLMVLACDQDPFHLAERRIAGDYRLNRWEDGATYYLVTPSTREAPGGVIEGTVAQIGWTADQIIVWSKPLMGDSTWVVINVATGAVERFAFLPPAAKTIALWPAAEAWADLR